MRKIYKTGHFFVKNTMIFLCFFLILIIISGITVFNNFMNESDRKMIENAENDVINLRNISDETFTQIEKQIINMSLSWRIIQTVTNVPTEELLPSKITYITTEISHYFGGIQHIDNVYLYSRYRDYVYTRLGTIRKNDFGNEEILKISESIEKKKVKMLVREANGKKLFTLLYKIDEGKKVDGLIIVDVDFVDYMQFYSTDGMILLAETNTDNIIYSRDYRMPNELASKIIPKENEIVKQGGEYYISAREPSSYGGIDFIIINRIPGYSKNRLQLYISLILIIIALALLFAAFSVYLSKLTYKPISELAELVDNPFSEKSKKYLENDINTKKIADRLFLIVSNNEILKSELNTKMENLNFAQLKALQWQINPHFVFNTLNMLYYFSEESKVGNGVSKGIMSLSRLMRYCLKTEPMIVDVKTEIEYAQEYVKIMTARLGDSFKANWNIGEKFMDYPMVKMTVQPILENCFRYGFKNIDYKGIIDVSSVENDEYFGIVISDNGVGMTNEKIEETNEYLKNSPAIVENHIGLANVNSRIVLTYGEKYGVEISKNESGGVRVTVKFPKIKQNY